MILRLWLLGGTLLVAGCPNSTPPSGDMNFQGDAGVMPDMIGGPSYTFEMIPSVGQGGFQTEIASAGGKVGLVTLSNTNMTGMCKNMNGIAMAQTTYDIWYAESAGGAPFKTTKVTSQQYLALMGVGIAMSPAGDAAVAYTGGPPAGLRCGASDAELVTESGGAFGAQQTIATDSPGTPVPDQASQCVQDVCNQGDAVGFWPAIAWSPQGKLGYAYRDIHFGFAMDDFEKSDVEYVPPGGGGPITVDVARGGGAYLRLGYTPGGQAAIAHYNIAVVGIWVNHQKPDNTWEAVQVTQSSIGEQLGFGVSPSGKMALAWYDDQGQRLSYTESMDGSTWAAPIDIDTDGNTGLYPSLAFDGAGEPAIAYYRCNDYMPGNGNCDPSKDGLYVARHTGGKWKSHVVKADSGISDGLYPAIAFVGGKEVIAYQTRFYDQMTMKSQIALAVAREK